MKYKIGDKVFVIYTMKHSHSDDVSLFHSKDSAIYYRGVGIVCGNRTDGFGLPMLIIRKESGNVRHFYHKDIVSCPNNSLGDLYDNIRSVLCNYQRTTSVKAMDTLRINGGSYSEPLRILSVRDWRLIHQYLCYEE